MTVGHGFILYALCVGSACAAVFEFESKRYYSGAILACIALENVIERAILYANIQIAQAKIAQAKREKVTA